MTKQLKNLSIQILADVPNCRKIKIFKLLII